MSECRRCGDETDRHSVAAQPLCWDCADLGPIDVDEIEDRQRLVTDGGTPIGMDDHPLEVGEETIVYIPELSITHHTVRRTEDGYETCSTLTEWHPVSREEVAKHV